MLLILEPRLSNVLLSEVPNYYVRKRQEPTRAFLVTGEVFTRYERSLRIEPAVIPAVKDETVKLMLYGYVDYIDVFGKRHRSGYARDYSPKRDNRADYPYDEEFETRNNLVFMEQRGYNYDRLRKKGEGNDWDKADI